MFPMFVIFLKSLYKFVNKKQVTTLIPMCDLYKVFHAFGKQASWQTIWYTLKTPEYHLKRGKTYSIGISELEQ